MLLGTVGIPLSHLALEWMQPSPELNQLTQDFFHTRLFGLPAALASYALVGWFLGTQNARAPLAILLTTNLVNIALKRRRAWRSWAPMAWPHRASTAWAKPSRAWAVSAHLWRFR